MPRRWVGREGGATAALAPLDKGVGMPGTVIVESKVKPVQHPRGGSVVDYWQVPTERPAQWPEVRDNTDGLQRFVYARMHDFLRKVSAHVSIGRAWREHKATDNYFVLCREG